MWEGPDFGCKVRCAVLTRDSALCDKLLPSSSPS